MAFDLIRRSLAELSAATPPRSAVMTTVVVDARASRLNRCDIGYSPA